MLYYQGKRKKGMIRWYFKHFLILRRGVGECMVEAYFWLRITCLFERLVLIRFLQLSGKLFFKQLFVVPFGSLSVSWSLAFLAFSKDCFVLFLSTERVSDYRNWRSSFYFYFYLFIFIHKNEILLCNTLILKYFLVCLFRRHFVCLVSSRHLFLTR